MPTSEPAATAILLTICGILLLVSVLSSRASQRIGVPIALFFLVVGMLLAYNALLSSVLQRRSELALLRALGAPREVVALILGAEALARPIVQAASEARGEGETGGSGRSSDEAAGQQNPGEQRTRGVAV